MSATPTLPLNTLEKFFAAFEEIPKTLVRSPCGLRWHSSIVPPLTRGEAYDACPITLVACACLPISSRTSPVGEDGFAFPWNTETEYNAQQLSLPEDLRVLIVKSVDALQGGDPELRERFRGTV